VQSGAETFGVQELSSPRYSQHPPGSQMLTTRSQTNRTPHPPGSPAREAGRPQYYEASSGAIAPITVFPASGKSLGNQWYQMSQGVTDQPSLGPESDVVFVAPELSGGSLGLGLVGFTESESSLGSHHHRRRAFGEVAAGRSGWSVGVQSEASSERW
jgi:hypothetical protein